MITVAVIIVLLVCLILVARRSSKNRETILIEVLLGVTGSVLAAVAVTSFPKINTDDYLGYLDRQVNELIFGKTAEEPKVALPEKKAVTIKKNVSTGDLKIEGVYAGLIRSVQNGSDVLSEKAYILRVEPAKNEKVLEIYQGGDVEYKVRIDGRLEKDGVTWVGETKSVLKGGTFVQDDLKLLVSPEAGRIDWHQRDKVQQIESIGTLYKVDEELISERVSAINRIKNNIFLCKEKGASANGGWAPFLFVPFEGGVGKPKTLSLEKASYADKLFAEILTGYAKEYEGLYELHVKTGFKSNEFPSLSGMNMLTPDLSSFMGSFTKEYSIGVNRPGDSETWFKESMGEKTPCRIFYLGFPPGPGANARQ